MVHDTLTFDPELPEKNNVELVLIDSGKYETLCAALIIKIVRPFFFSWKSDCEPARLSYIEVMMNVPNGTTLNLRGKLSTRPISNIYTHHIYIYIGHIWMHRRVWFPKGDPKMYRSKGRCAIFGPSFELFAGFFTWWILCFFCWCHPIFCVCVVLIVKVEVHCYVYGSCLCGFSLDCCHNIYIWDACFFFLVFIAKRCVWCINRVVRSTKVNGLIGEQLTIKNQILILRYIKKNNTNWKYNFKM